MKPKDSPTPFVPRFVATERKLGRCGCGHPIMSRSESAQTASYADHEEFRVRTFAAVQMGDTIRKEREQHPFYDPRLEGKPS